MSDCSVAVVWLCYLDCVSEEANKHLEGLKEQNNTSTG